MIRTSELTNELAEAFARAQAKFTAAIKSSINPAFPRSKYADITSIIDATLEHLNAEGIGVRQHPSLEYKAVGDGVEAYSTITTRIQHKSGQWEESEMSIPAVQRDKFDGHSVGSGLTYAARYALQNIFVVPRADDDGNAAVGIGSAQAAQAVADKKIAEHKAKRANGAKSEPVTTLFYTVPNEHNGHFAEFINIKEFGSGMDQVAAEGLKQVLKPYIARVTKSDTILVSTSKMDELLDKLAGDCGITIKLLANPSA